MISERIISHNIHLQKLMKTVRIVVDVSLAVDSEFCVLVKLLFNQLSWRNSQLCSELLKMREIGIDMVPAEKCIF